MKVRMRASYSDSLIPRCVATPMNFRFCECEEISHKDPKSKLCLARAPRGRGSMTAYNSIDHAIRGVAGRAGGGRRGKDHSPPPALALPARAGTHLLFR